MIVDTKNKTVTPDGESLGEITASLQAMFPGGEWKAYKVTATPITITLKEVDKGMQQIPYVPYNPYPVSPINPYWYWDQWRIICQDTLLVAPNTGTVSEINGSWVLDTTTA